MSSHRLYTQITPSTLKIMKDLKDPDIAIPMGVRWLFRKRATAMNQLKRAPDHEELILEYKGLLKSNSDYKKSGLKKYREVYAKLKE